MKATLDEKKNKKELKFAVKVVEEEDDVQDFRQNFDLVTPEGDDPDKNSLWGLPVREFVPDTVISWVEHLQDEEPVIYHGDNVVKKVKFGRQITNEKTTRKSCFLIIVR